MKRCVIIDISKKDNIYLHMERKMKKNAKIWAAIVAIVMICSMLSGCGMVAEDTVKIEKGEAKIIAHRGLSGLEVENTDAAFIAAGERSYYGIESDVRRTADGKFVMCHDADLERISGQKIDVESSTLEELQQIPLLNKKGEKDDSIHLTTLENYISICKEYDKQAILELKSSFTKDEVGSIIDIITALDYLDRVTFISFDYDNLLYVREYSADQSAMYLFSKMSDETADMLIRDRIDVAIKITKLTKGLIERFHEAGLNVNCWTVDSKALAEIYSEWGVDYITSNILE